MKLFLTLTYAKKYTIHYSMAHTCTEFSKLIFCLTCAMYFVLLCYVYSITFYYFMKITKTFYYSIMYVTAVWTHSLRICKLCLVHPSPTRHPSTLQAILMQVVSKGHALRTLSGYRITYFKGSLSLFCRSPHQWLDMWQMMKYVFHISSLTWLMVNFQNFPCD